MARWDIMVISALAVVVIGVILLLGYLGTDIGAHWTTVQNLVAPFVILISLAIVTLAVTFRRG